MRYQLRVASARLRVSSIRLLAVALGIVMGLMVAPVLRAQTARAPGPSAAPGPVIGPLEGLKLGFDPQVTAGDNYVAVIEAHSLAFYDKAGVPVPNPSPSTPYRKGSLELFQRLLGPKNPDGSVNQDNVNLHAGFSPNAKWPCDLADPSAQKGCVNEVFDMRSAFDPKRHRFVFAGMGRNQMRHCTDATKPVCDMGDNDVFKLVRRFTMIAISKTEDPREGFNEYWLPTGGDWPSLVVNNSHLLVTMNGIGTFDPSTTPLIYIVSLDDIAGGSGQPKVFRYFGSDLGSPKLGGLRPVLSHDAGAPDYFVAPNAGFLQVWASRDPTKPLVTAKIELQEAGFIRGSVVLQSGKLYYTYASGAWCKTMKPVPTDCPLKIRLVAIRLNWSNNTLTLSKALDSYLDDNAQDKEPSDLVSDEMPSLEVTRNGDVVIAYVRRAVRTAKPLYNEARYSLLYHNEASARPSVLFKKGEGVATAIPGRLDLAVQSLDPDGLTVWITQAYAKAEGGYYGMSWGAVKP